MAKRQHPTPEYSFGRAVAMIQTTSGSWARPRHAAMRSPARRIGSGVEQVLKSLEHSLDGRLRKCVHTHHAWLPFRRFIARTVLPK